MMIPLMARQKRQSLLNTSVTPVAGLRQLHVHDTSTGEFLIVGDHLGHFRLRLCKKQGRLSSSGEWSP
jgi:hypothetical protein